MPQTQIIGAVFDQLPDAELWQTHQALKVQMVTTMRSRIQQQLLRHGEGPRRLEAASKLLDPNAFTIGFARRFATYKRAMLIFCDPERNVTVHAARTRMREQGRGLG